MPSSRATRYRTAPPEPLTDIECARWGLGEFGVAESFVEQQGALIFGSQREVQPRGPGVREARFETRQQPAAHSPALDLGKQIDVGVGWVAGQHRGGVGGRMVDMVARPVAAVPCRGIGGSWPDPLTQRREPFGVEPDVESGRVEGAEDIAHHAGWSLCDNGEIGLELEIGHGIDETDQLRVIFARRGVFTCSAGAEADVRKRDPIIGARLSEDDIGFAHGRPASLQRGRGPSRSVLCGWALPL